MDIISQTIFQNNINEYKKTDDDNRISIITRIPQESTITFSTGYVVQGEGIDNNGLPGYSEVTQSVDKVEIATEVVSVVTSGINSRTFQAYFQNEDFGGYSYAGGNLGCTVLESYTETFSEIGGIDNFEKGISTFGKDKAYIRSKGLDSKIFDTNTNIVSINNNIIAMSNDEQYGYSFNNYNSLSYISNSNGVSDNKIFRVNFDTSIGTVIKAIDSPGEYKAFSSYLDRTTVQGISNNRLLTFFFATEVMSTLGINSGLTKKINPVSAHNGYIVGGNQTTNTAVIAHGIGQIRTMGNISKARSAAASFAT